MTRYLFILLAILAWAIPAPAAEVIPSSPRPDYIADPNHVLSPPVFAAINSQLLQEEQQTSNQIVVGIYPHMQSDDDISAYAVRVFQAWKLGQAGKNNGVLLLIFTDDHKLWITTGYGLEGALPDATCKQIIDTDITPHFKSDPTHAGYDAGVQAGVNAIIAATKGEYKGNGWTHYKNVSFFSIAIFVIFGLIVISTILSGIYGTTYASNGRTPSWVIPFILFSNFTSRGGGGWSGGRGGGWSGGGGGFSGGGGSTGGGGAGGSW